MAYIGRSTDKISNIEILDNITFDGSSSYSITKSSVAFIPNSAQSLLISIDGVVQAGNFTVSGSTIDFGVAIPSTSTCDFFLHYGTGLITTPADGTVTNDKINYPLAKSGATVSTFNRTTSDGTILELQKDGSEVGKIGTLSGNLFVGSLDTGIYFNNSEDRIYPLNTTTNAGRDNAIDLGKDGTRFKDLYLGGGLYVGGTGTANKLDDYEEGTWTPTISDGTTNWTGNGHFRKTGSLVFVQMYMFTPPSALYNSASTLKLSNFPFAIPSADYQLYQPFVPFNMNANNSYGAWGIYFKGTAFDSDIRWFNDDATPTDLVGTDLNSNTVFRMGFSYITN